MGDYRPATRWGELVFSAGMTPRVAGELTVTGRLGAGVDLAAGRSAAALAATNALAAVAALATGSERIAAVLELTVWIACAPDFTELSAVADGASAGLAERLGRDAPPARAAIGVQSLPGGAPVEVRLVVALGPA
jgi:enamine deaminase RidA (YjgF/YER057c/UK114 family)